MHVLLLNVDISLVISKSNLFFTLEGMVCYVTYMENENIYLYNSWFQPAALSPV